MTPQLTMPLYVDPTDVCDRMQLDSGVTGVLAEVTKAIMRAELYVQSILDSTLIRQSWSPVFYTDDDAFSGIQPNGVFRLELPSGFVRQDTPVVVTVSSISQQSYLESTSLAFFDQGDGPFTTFVAIDPTQMKVDYLRGYVFVSASQYRNLYVQVQFDAGYEPGTTPLPVTTQPAFDTGLSWAVGSFCVGTDGNVYQCVTAVAPGGTTPPNVNWIPGTVAIEQLPMPLYEAIMSYVPAILDSQQSKARDTERTEKIILAEHYALQLVKAYTRWKGFSFRPLWNV